MKQPYWAYVLEHDDKIRAQWLDEYRVEQLKSDIHSIAAWDNVCREFGFPYAEAFTGSVMNSKFRRVLNDIHLLSVFGSHSFHKKDLQDGKTN